MTQQAESLTPEEREEQMKRWHQEEFVKIQKYCQTNGIQLRAIDQTKTKCLPPLVGVWYANSTQKGEDFWILSGDLPTDFAPAKVAKDAREALRYFSMNWQLKAANLEDGLAEGKIKGDRETQVKYIKELSGKAEAMYQLHSEEKLWAEAGL